jgi:hypothetical protein
MDKEKGKGNTSSCSDNLWSSHSFTLTVVKIVSDKIVGVQVTVIRKMHIIYQEKARYCSGILYFLRCILCGDRYLILSNMIGFYDT